MLTSLVPESEIERVRKMIWYSYLYSMEYPVAVARCIDGKQKVFLNEETYHTLESILYYQFRCGMKLTKAKNRTEWDIKPKTGTLVSLDMKEQDMYTVSDMLDNVHPDFREEARATMTYFYKYRLIPSDVIDNRRVFNKQDMILALRSFELRLTKGMSYTEALTMALGEYGLPADNINVRPRKKNPEERRCEILEAINTGNNTIKDIAEVIGIEYMAVRKHLNDLEREGRIVKNKSEKTYTFSIVRC